MLTNVLMFLIQATPPAKPAPAGEGFFDGIMSDMIGGLFDFLSGFSEALIAKVNSVILRTFPQSTIMRIVYAFIFVNLVWKIMETLIRSIRTSGGFDMTSWLGELFGRLAEILPKFSGFVVMAMVAAAGANVVLDYPPERGSSYFEITKSQAVKDAVRPIYNQFNPSGALKSACTSMSTAVGRLSYIRLRSQVIRSTREMSDNATYKPPGMVAASAGAVAGAFASLADKILYLWMGIGEWIFSIFNDFAFMFAQFSMAKALILNYVYFSVAWNTSIALLPVMILMAYFDIFRGFLENVVKHLVILSISGFIVANLASFLASSTLWEGIIKSAFNSVKASPTDLTTLAVGSMPNLFSMYAVWIANVQLSMILMIMGKILENMYDITAGTLYGSVPRHLFYDNLSAGWSKMVSRKFSGLQG